MVTQTAILAAEAVVESAAAGSGSDVVSYAGPWTATANAAWLHSGSTGNGDGLATFTFDANTGPARTGTLTIAGQTLTVTQAAALGSVALMEGPAAGTDSDVGRLCRRLDGDRQRLLAAHLRRGSGNGLATFTFDANTGATRTGTLTIAGETLTVTQAGSSYVAANPLTTLVSSGLSSPSGVAVDGSGNVYIADTGNNAIKEWNAATQTRHHPGLLGAESPLWRGGGRLRQRLHRRQQRQRDQGVERRDADLTTLVSSGLNRPRWRGGGRRGQRLHRRYRQQRDQGVERRDADRQHPGLLGAELPEWRGGGRRGQRLHRR